MEVSCGSCLGCRLDRARMWSLRIVHEASLHEFDAGNCFVTLTYRDREQCDEEQLRKGYHVPDDFSHKRETFGLFMKRLRKAHPGQRIRFYHAAEYGDVCLHALPVSMCPGCNVGRPHHHAILFNCSFDDLEAIGSKRDVVHYTSKKLADIWKHGHVQVGDVNTTSAGYVARYCVKKITGWMQDEHYRNVDIGSGEVTFIRPEFSTMSRRPGIAAEWFEKFKADVYPSDLVPVVGEGRVQHKAPRYYDKLLEAEDPELLEEVKEARQEFREEHADEYSTDRLIDKYKVKVAQVKTLKRGLQDV